LSSPPSRFVADNRSFALAEGGVRLDDLVVERLGGSDRHSWTSSMMASKERLKEFWVLCAIAQTCLNVAVLFPLLHTTPLSGHLGDAVRDRVAAGLGEPARQSDQAVGFTSTGPANSTCLRLAPDGPPGCRDLVRGTSTPGRRTAAVRSSPFLVPICLPSRDSEENKAAPGLTTSWPKEIMVTLCQLRE
jgi:hypothetical protein